MERHDLRLHRGRGPRRRARPVLLVGLGPRVTDVPIAWATGIGGTLLTAIGFLVRHIIGLYTRINDIQEKRVGERDELIKAEHETAEAMRMVAAEMREQRDARDRAIAAAREDVIRAIREQK